jgi:hypothetical protein
MGGTLSPLAALRKARLCSQRDDSPTDTKTKLLGYAEHAGWSYVIGMPRHSQNRELIEGICQ